MSNVNFAFNGQTITVQCKKNEKMKEICQKFGAKTGIDINKYYYLNGGKLINLESNFEDITGEINGKNILVIDKLDSNINKEDDFKSLVKSKDVICPKCQENCILYIKNYKIKLADCKNGHRTNNIFLDEYYNTQFINESNIKCGGNNCKNSKSEAFNGKFYKCYNCKINLCPLCYSKHDKKHKLINYDKKNYICEKHNELFISYCENCKINLCMQCEMEHNNHNQIPYKNVIPNKDEVEIKIKDFKNKIDKMSKNIENIINMLNKVKNHMNLLYNINYDILNNYEIENRNYELFKNLIAINNIDFKNIDEIINNNDTFIKFKNILNIYNQMITKDKVLNKMKMIYKVGYLDEIRILHKDFVENNKDKCKLIINGNETNLSEFINIKNMNIKDKLEIILIETNTITNMYHMFRDCSNLFSLPDFSEWDTSNITNLHSLFNGCTSLSFLSDISKWNTENVNTIRYMFWGVQLTQLPDISKWNTSNVTDFQGVFSTCSQLLSLPDISKWDTSNVINMKNLFKNCFSLKSLPDISKWNTSNVNDMSYLFLNCKSLLSLPDISKWNLDKVNSFSGMFEGCNKSIIPEKFKNKI